MSKIRDIISFPKYNITLPSNKTCFFRPFTVREESSLLLAKQSEDSVNIAKTLIDIMSSCFEEENITEYSLIDFEYAFLKLREKSIGEIERVTIKCPVTKESVKVTVDLTKDIQIRGTEQKNKINLGDGIVVKINQPNIQILLNKPDFTKNIESRFEFIAESIVEIQKDKKILTSEDLSKEELKEFVENLTSKQFKTLIEYFDNTPRLSIDLNYTASDGVNRTVELSGTFNIINFFFNHISLQTFFTLMFQMKYFHNYSMEEFYSMLPWQRQVLIQLITNELEKQKDTQNNYA